MASSLSRTLIGLVVLGAAPAPSVADDLICNGIEIPASVEELASTPRKRFDLEVLAATMDSSLVVEQSFYERVVDDVDRIHALAPDVAGISHSSHDYSGRLRLDVDAATEAGVLASTYDAWDCLNDAFGLEVFAVDEPAHQVVIGTAGAEQQLGGVFDLDVLSELYAQLPGVLAAAPEPSGVVFIVAPATICGIRDDTTVHYFFEDPLAGDTFYFTSEPDERPTLWGARRPTGNPYYPPLWLQLRDACFAGETILVGSEIAVEPSLPKETEEIVLTVSGEDASSSCGPFYDDVAIYQRDGEIRIFADFNASCDACTADAMPYSFDIPVDGLEAGGYRVTYLVRDGCSGEETVRATSRFDVHTKSAPALRCGVERRAAATLLVPWLEVDLDDPDGADTLVSIGNASPNPVLANVVLWSDWGLPVLDFPVYLEGDGSLSLSLRRILTEGALPADFPSAPADAGMGCGTPLNEPLDGPTLARLRAQLTGQPIPEDGSCWGSVQEDTGRAVGFATVDVVRSCSDTARTPRDPGYFGENGRAGDDNVLWGEVFFLDPGQDLASGIGAVPIVADPVQYPDHKTETFYSALEGDHRRPLPRRARARSVRGGLFDGGTDYLVWVLGTTFLEASTYLCGRYPFDFFGLEVATLVADERGRFLGRDDRRIVIANRFRGDLPDFSITSFFGFADFEAWGYCGLCDPPQPPDPVRLWVVPLVTASGRFSVAYDGIQLDVDCP